MNLRKIIVITGYLLAAGLTGSYLVSCSKPSLQGMVIVTRVPVTHLSTDQKILMSHYEGADLVAFNPNAPGESEVHLTEKFHSACSPQISYDATHLLFMGQKNEQDPWQVWEMDLKEKTSTKITDFKESCAGPAYLPGERLVFSREMPDTGTGRFHTLFTMNLDGSNIQQITFHPHFDYVSTILRDGRILMRSKQVFPKEGAVKYLAMRPNGTKAELFYKGISGFVPGYQVHETTNGLIYFIEQKTGKDKKRNVVSILYNRPLHTRVNYTSEIAGSFYAVLPLPSGDMLVSYRPSDGQTIGLYHFSREKKSIGESLFRDPKYHILEPVMIEPYARPRNLPNELMPSYPTGLLMCQDIKVTAILPENGLTMSKATHIEVLGMNNSLGIIPLEPDGSFFLKLTADLPFRMQTLDDHKKVISGPSGWLWVRPFERRGCVGCHEDPELAPENIVPMAINYFPIVVPIDSTQLLKRAETFKLGDFH